MSKFKFSDTENTKIKETVSKVEETTSSEIVVFFVKQSDNYYEAPFIASLIIILLSIVCLNILSQFWLLPIKFNVFTFSLILIVMLISTFLIVELIPSLKILVISEKRERKMVRKRALEAFVSEEIFKTKQRTGILIFISELERNVEIIADSGINQKVNQEQWKSIVEQLSFGINKKNTLNSIVKAIEDCGLLLVKAGFVANGDNINELSDDLKNEMK